MTVVAVTMVKDEDDIIGTTVGHMLSQVDHVIVADNLSTDDTRFILDELADRHPDELMVVDDNDPAYRQSEKMTALAHLAHNEFGADWIVPFDADEIWYSPFDDVIADGLDDVADQWLVMTATVYDHVATGADDLNVFDPVRRIGWRRLAGLPLPKVACRYRSDLTIGMGNHQATYAGGATVHDPQLVIRHFPYRSVEQLVRKVRNGADAYRLTDLPESYGAHWRQWGQILDQSGEQAIDDLFHEWYYEEDPEGNDDLIFDPAPSEV